MLALRRATTNDVSLLAQMNKRLIEDEGSTNPMSLPQLESRLRLWLTAEWRGELFLHDEAVVGYAIYRLQRSDFDNRETVYIRHYFIERDYRRLGYGREGLNRLREERFPKNVTVYLEVLTHNTRGREFWQAMGFEEYSVTMRLEGESERKEEREKRKG
jgi:GNAT superfamily N-acetyltransferase